MLGASLLVLLGVWCRGSTSQPTVIQESSMSPSLGQTAKLSCSLSSGQVTSYSLSWLQQKEGSPPRLLFYYYDSATAGSGDLSRFSASRESNQNKWYLTISNLQPEDEAGYYCGVWYHPSNVWVFGAGTQMTVGGQPTVSPTVRAFSPPQEDIRRRPRSAQDKVTLVCLISDFYPANFNLKWKADGNLITSGVETSKATKQGDKYLASSYLSLPPSVYGKSNLYTCEVTHEGKTITKSVSPSGSC